MLRPPNSKIIVPVILFCILAACAQKSAFYKEGVTAEIWRKHQEDCWSIAVGDDPKHYPKTTYFYDRPAVPAYFAGGLPGGIAQGIAEGEADVAAYRNCMRALGYSHIDFDEEIKTKFNALDTDAEKIEYLKQINSVRKKSDVN